MTENMESGRKYNIQTLFANEAAGTDIYHFNCTCSFEVGLQQNVFLKVKVPGRNVDSIFKNYIVSFRNNCKLVLHLNHHVSEGLRGGGGGGGANRF